MAPLMLFLASSFNIELVYVILKGITQFSYLTCSDGKSDFMNKKTNKLIIKTENDGSKTLTMREIKIKDLDKWSDVKAKDVKESDKFIRQEVNTGDQMDEDSNVLRMKQKVEVTYHRLEIFKEMFSEYFDS